jgi:ATP-dependent helicase HepA
VMYRWGKQGVQRDEQIVAIARDEQVEDFLGTLPFLLEDAPEVEFPPAETWSELDARHHVRWLAESARHADDNRQLVAARIQSLSASFNARRRALQGQLGSATNDKIRLMKQSELERAQADYDTRRDRLERAAQSGDIRATPVLLGVLKIRRAN